MKIRFRHGYANITATLALVVALGGTGYAAATIGTSDIKKNAVTSAKIRNNQVKAPDVADIKMRKLKLVSGWTPYPDSSARVGKSAEGVVHLSGGVFQGGVFGPLIAVLPPAYRPIAGDALVATGLVNGRGPARLHIGTNGEVRIQVAPPAASTDAQAFTSLNVSFVR